eukprot:6187338-Amphidinium_carterae.1
MSVTVCNSCMTVCNLEDATRGSLSVRNLTLYKCCNSICFVASMFWPCPKCDAWLSHCLAKSHNIATNKTCKCEQLRTLSSNHTGSLGPSWPETQCTKNSSYSSCMGGQKFPNTVATEMITIAIPKK